MQKTTLIFLLLCYDRPCNAICCDARAKCAEILIFTDAGCGSIMKMVGHRPNDICKRRIIMKTKIIKAPTPICSKLLRAERSQGRIYSLIELRIFEDTVYCISVTDEEFAAELCGEDAGSAQTLFDLLCTESVPSYQLFDVVSDQKRASAAK